MPLIKGKIIRDSEFLRVLHEDQQIGEEEYVECNVPISKDIISTLTELFENPSALETFSDYKNLPDLFRACSFLQIQSLVDFLVQLLNKLCQYDDPALVPLQGAINPYWLGDYSKLKAATKVWLGLLTLPLKKKEDDSCFSSLKLLSGKIPDKELVMKIIECTEKEEVCIKLIEPFLKLISESLCEVAAKNGRLKILQWARENGCPWNEVTCCYAAAHGHLEFLQWARENGCPWDEWTCSNAALNGHLKVLKWARENGCTWDYKTCYSAARKGHLEILQWARQNGCPWNESTCSGAAMFGHLKVLQWARSNGCPWDELTLTWAKRGGHLEVMQWACKRLSMEKADFLRSLSNGSSGGSAVGKRKRLSFV
jgi:hypothetical protein